MRRFIASIVLVLVATLAWGCASESSTGTAEESKAFVMQSAGHDVLKLMVVSSARCTPKADSINLRSGDSSVDVWLVAGASSVDEAVAKVPAVIKEEFKEFKSTSTTPMTIAGAPAKHLLGTGEEADDGDPGTADVVVFKVGDHVFVSCTHGESLSPVAQKWMLTVVGTAQAP